MILGVYVLCILFSSLIGIYDAFFYSRKGADALEGNEHIVMVLIRGIFGVTLISASVLHIYDAVVLFTCFVFMYSFFHNGCYYIMRDKIDEKVLTIEKVAYLWMYQSSTDSSKVHFGYTSRCVQMIVSLLLLLKGRVLLEKTLSIFE